MSGVHWGYRHPYVYTVIIWIAATLSFILANIAMFFLACVAAPCGFILEKLEGFDNPRELTKHLWEGVWKLRGMEEE